jgi:hypothetical protein
VLGRDADGKTVVSHAGASSITIGFMFLDFTRSPASGEAYVVSPQRRLMQFRLVGTSPGQRFELVGPVSPDRIQNPEHRAMLEGLLAGPVPTPEEYDESVAGLAGKQPKAPQVIHVLQPP